VDVSYALSDLRSENTKMSTVIQLISKFNIASKITPLARIYVGMSKSIKVEQSK
jgi:hypothetical protein